MRNNKNYKNITRVRINHEIRVPEVRVLDEEGKMLGVMQTKEAQKEAERRGVDMIEITANSTPPVVRLMDYGKYQYETKKKEKEAKAKSKSTETKNLQVKIGTGEHDLALKAKKASVWLKEGHRVKLDLYLRGRAQYLDKDFLKGRLMRLLTLITEPYKVAEEPKKSPKGLTTVIERGKVSSQTSQTD